MVDVRIDALAPGGDAVGRQEGGRHAGRATFVPLAAPGERVKARLGRVKARVAWGELVSIGEPSPVRVAPPCPYFGTCGGCQWQHVSLEAQRAAKRAIVERALGAAVTVLQAPVPEGTPYRDRARLSVGSAGEVGFRARRDHRIVDVERCLLLTPSAAAALAAVRPMARRWPAGTEIDLQAGNDGVHVAVRLGLASATAEQRPATAEEVLRSARDAGVVGVRLDRELAGAPDVDVAEPG
ncbi:MAG TPA: TRAM domain-containing protein, partial [Polyangia bacterium]